MHAEINVINSKLLFTKLTEPGQFIQAIDTHVRAVRVPMPWEIIRAGGTIIDRGL